MLPSVKAVKDLSHSCKTLIYWQGEKDKGNKLATKQLQTWIALVTEQTVKAKLLVAKLNVDNFVQHSIELVDYNVDITAIQSVQLVASKQSFTAYHKLKEQLEMFEMCTNYALSEASKIANVLIENRIIAKKLQVVDTAIVKEAKGKQVTFSKLNTGYTKVTKDPELTDLLRIGRKIQPAIDKELEQRFTGIMAREKRQKYKAQQMQAEKFMRNALKQDLDLAEKEKV
jgi:hypothetical protein